MTVARERESSDSVRPRRCRLAWALLACAAAAWAAPLRAQTELLELDPAETQIEFTLPAMLHTVHGSFHMKHGTVRFDPAGGVAGGSIVVDAASGDSGNKGRDRKMHEKILESKQYPDITFTPARVDGRVAAQGRSQVEVRGLCRLHGAEHEITAPATVEVVGSQWMVTLRFVVPYVAWGLKNPSTLLLRVSSQVTIEVHSMGHILAASGRE